jgi:hypothetical protein
MARVRFRHSKACRIDRELGVAKTLAVLPIEQVADCRTAGGIHFALPLLAEDAGNAGIGCFARFGFAASGAAIGEAGLAGLQLKFFSTSNTGFDRKGHIASMVAKNRCGNR